MGRARVLPEDVQRSLRLAFRAEVQARLSHLKGDDLELARHDAHTLSSSAWVVGEVELSRLARAAEDDPSARALAALVTALEEWLS